ncbi:hypothetical protein [Massilia sp. DD77]|uniref:hypothetical protein n=1 Tax=Massilia sp. DD77 TaxID=3109349 RepID=UPI002FFECF9F
MKKHSVMRDTIEFMRDQFSAEAERWVLFTTFNFAPQFFETNVLPILAGDTLDEPGASQETRYALNDELSRIHCLVACDRSTAPEPKGDLRYGLLPVGLPRGRFHSKLILMAGTLKDTGLPGVWLSVGSANISLSGWALNREVVSATPVTTQHAAELLPLLRWLVEQAQRQLQTAPADVEEEGQGRRILQRLVELLQDGAALASHSAGMPTLHVAQPQIGRASLLDSLTQGRKWRRATVVSPYWSDVGGLAAEIGAAECRFVPSLSHAGYRFPVGAGRGKERAAWSFVRFADERYTHAKALLLEDAAGVVVLCLGSANFTAAALGKPDGSGLSNIEAMLRHELAAVPGAWRELRPLDEADLVEASADEDEEGAPALPPFEASVFHDWQTGMFGGYLAIDPGADLAYPELEVAGRTVHFSPTPGVRQELVSFKSPCTVPLRSFRLSWREADGTVCSYRGLVLQVNAQDEQLQYQPRPQLDKVIDFLRSLNPALTEDELRKQAARGRGESSGDGEDGSVEPSFDFFGLFQATWKLREHYGRVAKDGIARDPFDSLAGHSLSTLYRAITLQPASTAEELIGRYVQLAEVRELLASFARSGVHPPQGCICNASAVEEEIAALTDRIRTLLEQSPSFLSTFGSAGKGQVEAFLGWFNEEMKKEVSAHAL